MNYGSNFVLNGGYRFRDYAVKLLGPERCADYPWGQEDEGSKLEEPADV